MEFQYFDPAHAILIHDEIIKNSGGTLGILNKGLLKSVLEHLQNDIYYETMEAKLTHLFFSINKNHCFADGNKRASIVLSAYFLELNNWAFIVRRFIEEMENIAVDVADNRIDKDLLFEIISSIIYETDYSEELKLKIIYAKSSAL
ncbi:type II toxin-antitoxin system death-on-curing family toxin [Emticicia sp. TH156]|uniref:type II toxin-antitoxin system death-on-curing family toxin n=1 Tax=Emticicia sp. TH156 TaxID=2067454 RepID=UPI000C7632BF|nr:type II toxin-antitoxin system death-on-curing family toxin [Emticicia sp. TH156]PLK44809.1 type II toxin-antitoxin system death-on-curing family toxin [Emticicia sp. TH156]